MLDKAKVTEYLKYGIERGREIKKRYEHFNSSTDVIRVDSELTMLHKVLKQVEDGNFDTPLTEEVRQLREERDEALRIASELSTSLEWHRRILSEIKGQGENGHD